MHRSKRYAALLLATLLLTACATAPPAPSQPTGDPVPIFLEEEWPVVDGSTANIPLIAAAHSATTGIPLEKAESLVFTSGTFAAWQRLARGECDLLIVYEAPAEVSATAMEGFEIAPLGRDGLVFLVNEEQPVASLTCDELRAIYTGSVTNWKELGGNDTPILPYQRGATSGSQTLFLNLLMGEAEPMQPPAEQIAGAMGDLLETIASFDGGAGALGFSVYYYAEEMYAQPNLKMLAVEGIAPTLETIESGDYPLVNDFYVVINASEPEHSPARRLQEWLLSEQGTATLREAGYIPAT